MKFWVEKKVSGEIVRGTISRGEFYMVLLQPSKHVEPPTKQIKLTEKQLDLLIAELNQVKIQLHEVKS